MRTGCCFILLLIFSYIVRGQDIPSKTRDQVEQIAENSGRDLVPDDGIVQDLEYYQKHPLNINTATFEDLKSLHLISDVQIDHLLMYRKLNGLLIDKYELQSVPGWDVKTIQAILPYIVVGPAQTLQEQFLSRFHGQHTIQSSWARILEKAKGFDTSLKNHFLGSADHIQLRYRYQFKNLLQYGITGDKDPGEQFFRGTQKAGFDFYSFYFFIRKLGMIKALAIGDYTVSIGQGLIQWQAWSAGRGADVMSVKKESSVLLPYRSAGEYNYYRGAGITLQKGKAEITVFGSLKKVSGNVMEDSLEFISGLQTSGLHRTLGEIADKNKVRQLALGSNISYRYKQATLGLNTLYQHFSIPLIKSERPYNVYSFSGNRLMQSSIDYSYTFHYMHLFGEVASNMNQHLAVLAGSIITVHPKVDVSLVYRNLSRYYQTLTGNAFTENDLPVNEKGLYAGMTVRPNALSQLSGYADVYTFPWLRYGISRPSNGHDYMLQFIFQPDKKMSLQIRFRNNTRAADIVDSSIIRFPVPVVRKSLRLSIEDKLNDVLSIRSRCEVLWVDQYPAFPQQGFLAYVESSFKYGKRVHSGIRIQYFEADGYSSRIYAYEPGNPGGFGAPAYYDKGLHYYLSVQVSLCKNLAVKLLYTQTRYAGRSAPGTGLDAINGDTRSQLMMQVKYVI